MLGRGLLFHPRLLDNRCALTTQQVHPITNKWVHLHAVLIKAYLGII